MAAPDLKSALLYVGQRSGLTKGDAAHIKRWLAAVKDSVWEKIASDIKIYGELPPLVEGPYSSFIGSALRARRFAENVDSPSMQRMRKQQRDQQNRIDLLELAEKMDDVIRHYQNAKKRYALEGPPDPPGEPLRPRRIEAKNSLEWLQRTAQEITQLAERQPDDEKFWDNRIPLNVSRQSGGKRKRTKSREIGVFMRQMVNFMYEACGKPSHHAVAAMTNVAFTGVNVDPEDVRSACKPTTRAGRRRKTGALNR